MIAPLLISGMPLGENASGAAHASGVAPGLIAAGPAPPSTPNDTVTVQNQVVGNLSDFFGVGLNPGYSIANFTNETQGTPINSVVWPAATSPTSTT